MDMPVNNTHAEKVLKESSPPKIAAARVKAEVSAYEPDPVKKSAIEKLGGADYDFIVMTRDPKSQGETPAAIQGREAAKAALEKHELAFHQAYARDADKGNDVRLQIRHISEEVLEGQIAARANNSALEKLKMEPSKPRIDEPTNHAETVTKGKYVGEGWPWR